MKVKFTPQNVEVEIKPGESVLKVAHDHGLHIKSVCKGVPSCAECRIQIAEGEQNVFPPLPQELNLIGSAHFVDHSRLACQLKCFGDVTIDLKEQIEKASRNLASKRPRGIPDGDDYDPGYSSAVQGSILFNDLDPMAQKVKEEPSPKVETGAKAGGDLSSRGTPTPVSETSSKGASEKPQAKSPSIPKPLPKPIPNPVPKKN